MFDFDIEDRKPGGQKMVSRVVKGKVTDIGFMVNQNKSRQLFLKVEDADGKEQMIFDYAINADGKTESDSGMPYSGAVTFAELCKLAKKNPKKLLKKLKKGKVKFKSGKKDLLRVPDLIGFKGMFAFRVIRENKQVKKGNKWVSTNEVTLNTKLDKVVDKKGRTAAEIANKAKPSWIKEWKKTYDGTVDDNVKTNTSSSSASDDDNFDDDIPF